MYKAILFDLDDTLYDTSNQVMNARRNAVKAMVASGLDSPIEDVLSVLSDVVDNRGSNYGFHYDSVLESFGHKPDPKIVASGVVAYHETKTAYLVPYPDTVSTLLGLRDKGYLLGVVTDGVPVKQWEKLIRLGLKDFFHTVVVSGPKEKGKPFKEPFMKAVKNLSIEPGDCLFVGDRLDKDILGARNAGMASVQIIGRKYSMGGKVSELDGPDYLIERLSDLIELVERV